MELTCMAPKLVRIQGTLQHCSPEQIRGANAVSQQKLEGIHSDSCGFLYNLRSECDEAWKCSMETFVDRSRWDSRVHDENIQRIDRPMFYLDLFLRDYVCWMWK